MSNLGTLNMLLLLPPPPLLLQIDDRLQDYVLREIRNHQLLSGHPCIIQLKQATHPLPNSTDRAP
jgi:hypothetical protein